MKYILIIFYLISISSCLELNLVDNYFVKVYIGDSQTEFKLLVDPTYSFSFILKPYESYTKKTAEIEPLIFSNMYGNYSGVWSLDTFFFKEENFTIEMKFLDVYNKKSNLLKADGVLGLGLYEYLQFDRTIFYYLKNCSNNITIYDKINKKILLCEQDESTKSNKISVPLRYNDIVFNFEGVVNITKFIFNKKEFNFKKYTFIGLMPLLITSKDVNIELHDNLTYKIFIEGNKFIYEYDEKEINQVKSFLDIEEFVNNFQKNYLNNWYLGLDKKNVERVVIDYNKRGIDIFIKSYRYLIIRLILFMLILGFFIYALIDVLTKKKNKNTKNENEQELMDI